jgi:hypothetical protein
MADQAVIGNTFVFQTLFVDGAGAPFVPAVGPTIDVFNFSTLGVKQLVVTAEAMSVGVPAEVGRYTYAYSVPTTFTDGDMLYAEGYAEDGVGTVYRVAWEVMLIAATRSGAYNNAGLVARFIP